MSDKILNVFLDFDGVVHPMTQQFHNEMQKMEELGREVYQDKFPENFKEIDGTKVFWLPYYFQLADNIAAILSEFENNFIEIRLWVHSMWRGLGDHLIGKILETTNLFKYYKGIVPLKYNTSSRLINILLLMNTFHSEEQKHCWIALDDLEDLFQLAPDSFIRCNSDSGFDDNSKRRLVEVLNDKSGLTKKAIEAHLKELEEQRLKELEK